MGKGRNSGTPVRGARQRTFERGRRQQQVPQAILNQGVDLCLLPQLPELYNTYKDMVITDQDIGRLLQLATLAPDIRQNGIQHLYISGDQLTPWIEPKSGAQVQLPVWDTMKDTFRRLYLPPALNRATRPPITVEILNGTDNPDLPRLAAENLRWFGFEPVFNDEDIPAQEETTITGPCLDCGRHVRWLVFEHLVQTAQSEDDADSLGHPAETHVGAAAARHDGRLGLAARGEHGRHLLHASGKRDHRRGHTVHGVPVGRAVGQEVLGAHDTFKCAEDLQSPLGSCQRSAISSQRSAPDPQADGCMLSADS